MKVAVIGKGKTGSAVIELLGKDSVQAVYDSKNKVTAEKLKIADIAIVFVNATVFASILPELLQSQIPVVCGVTGFQWTGALTAQIQQNNAAWVVANNFSLSMVVIKEILAMLGRLQGLTQQSQFSLSETHHVNKVDAPSGTALSWQDWLGVENCPIESIRKEDVKGTHQLVIHNPFETIELTHTAHDRKLFAQGAIWAARYLLEHPELKGFYQFNELVRSVSW
ncbi:4-hydroxy-tetrahydrodipicolinate reductase [Facilibium subflavum]|uniref:4-hydroxy-tetrahydrodipicolinate reductase n=1 Tax=Facilibium subflavum TaxID=2219058 RepID=UPI000E656D73|nr:dihydrodipicolinate reductase C-terminal domain-containing protein [Facilibium subflavum]